MRVHAEKFSYQELWDLIYFSAKLTAVLLSTRLYITTPAVAPAGLCNPGLLPSFVPSWKRLQSSKRRGTIFSPGNRSPSSHKAKQNYAMRQDNVLGMWSLVACSQRSHSSRQPRCRSAAQNGGRLHTRACKTPQPCCRRNCAEPSPPLSQQRGCYGSKAFCNPGREAVPSPGGSQGHSRNITEGKSCVFTWYASRSMGRWRLQQSRFVNATVTLAAKGCFLAVLGASARGQIQCNFIW